MEIRENAMTTYSVCLDIGIMEPKYIETADGYWLDEYEDIENFELKGVPIDDEEALAKFCAQNLKIIFDGDLDEPDNFTVIRAVELVGPKFATIQASIIITDLSVYFHVEGKVGLSEEDFEDIFHLNEPTLSTDAFSIAYGDFSDYSATFEIPPGEGIPLNIGWKNDLR
ncbi:hypothetical protein N8718_02795 [Luminiphilus sp.]|nr:hypothetical protein [Luminiphilus sp.]